MSFNYKLSFEFKSRIIFSHHSDVVASLEAYTVADQAAGLGGGGGCRARNMKSIRPPLLAIFFMTNLYRTGGMAPSLPPLDPLLIYVEACSVIFTQIPYKHFMNILSPM